MRQLRESQIQDTSFSILLVAERLFSEVGSEKTTIADIARELNMSAASVYRFYSAKAEINEAVGRRLLQPLESVLEDIARGSEMASEKLRAFIAAIDKANADRLAADANMHHLILKAFNENWKFAHEHIEKITHLLREIISQGDRDEEFNVSDCGLAAILVRSACVRLNNPRLMVRFPQSPEPTLDQMVNFCLGALSQGMHSLNLDASDGARWIGKRDIGDASLSRPAAESGNGFRASSSSNSSTRDRFRL